MRELREFRALYVAFQQSGIEVAGVSLDTVQANRRWAERLKIPYPLLSDEDRAASRAFGILRRVGIGGWNIEFLRRSTFLVDITGHIVAQWTKVKVRGHAAEVLQVARVAAAVAADGGEAGESSDEEVSG